MFSHIFVSVTDFDRALRFYKPLMAALDVELRWSDKRTPWTGWHCDGKTRPYFVICKPYNGLPHVPGNGQMIAFSAKTRDAVCHAYTVALSNGGACEGQPGPRPQYHANYYGAYFRDPDGNKFCVACHEPEV